MAMASLRVLLGLWLDLGHGCCWAIAVWTGIGLGLLLGVCMGVVRVCWLFLSRR